MLLRRAPNDTLARVRLLQCFPVTIRKNIDVQRVVFGQNFERGYLDCSGTGRSTWCASGSGTPGTPRTPRAPRVPRVPRVIGQGRRGRCRRLGDVEAKETEVLPESYSV